jgi:hypothetical protein
MQHAWKLLMIVDTGSSVFAMQSTCLSPQLHQHNKAWHWSQAQDVQWYG